MPFPWRRFRSLDKGNAVDNVNHPTHYGGEDNPFEVIKVLEAWLTPEQFEGFLRGNAVKYQARYDKKGGIEDLKKAGWYLQRLGELLEKRNAPTS